MLTLVISACVPAEYEEALKVSSFAVKDSRSLLSCALQTVMQSTCLLCRLPSHDYKKVIIVKQCFVNPAAYMWV